MHGNIEDRDVLRTEINQAFDVGMGNLTIMGLHKQPIKCNYRVYSRIPSQELFAF